MNKFKVMNIIITFLLLIGICSFFGNWYRGRSLWEISFFSGVSLSIIIILFAIIIHYKEFMANLFLFLFSISSIVYLLGILLPAASDSKFQLYLVKFVGLTKVISHADGTDFFIVIFSVIAIFTLINLIFMTREEKLPDNNYMKMIFIISGIVLFLWIAIISSLYFGYISNVSKSNNILLDNVQCIYECSSEKIEEVTYLKDEKCYDECSNHLLERLSKLYPDSFYDMNLYVDYSNCVANSYEMEKSLMHECLREVLVKYERL